MSFRVAAASALTALTAAACGPVASAPDASPSAFASRVDQPLLTATRDQARAFDDGDALFDTPFFPADGLGPLYVDVSCGGCHARGLRGPGLDQRMVRVAADGVTTAADQSAFPYGHEIRARMTAGARTPVVAPDLADVLVTSRNPPAILGRGAIEAVSDAEIVRVAAEQAARTDGIHGRVSYVVYASATSSDIAFNPYVTGQTVIGRFGLKARIATLDDFAADAFQNDMGITSPLRPTELPNPDGLTDDQLPGVDTTLETLAALATYMRLSAIPTRAPATDADRALFAAAQCSACHVPALHTRADYPIALLADIDAPIFTDLLLHDMGAALADGMSDGAATSRQFRTAPLIGLRFARAFLHDGRTSALDAAIRAHGGEATGSAAAYAALSADDRARLLAYVGSL